MAFKTSNNQPRRKNFIEKTSSHPFQVRGVNGRIIVQKGRVFQIGRGGQEITVAGSYGGNMVDNIWDCTATTDNLIPVEGGNYLYLDIAFDREAGLCEFAFISEVKLECGPLPDPEDPDDLDTKIVPLARIVSVTNLPGADRLWPQVKIEQLWRSDYIEAPFGGDDELTEVSLVSSIAPMCADLIGDQGLTGVVTGWTVTKTNVCVWGKILGTTYETGQCGGSFF